jgi:hypothetical protein
MTTERKIDLTNLVAGIIDDLYLDNDEDGNPFYNPDKEWDSAADFMDSVSRDLDGTFDDFKLMLEWRKTHGMNTLEALADLPAVKGANLTCGDVLDGKFKEEFPDFTDLPEAIRLALVDGWLTDTSWHNDAMPSFCANGFRLSVNYKNMDDRDDCPGERFILDKLDTDEHPLGDELVGAFEDESLLDYVLEGMKDGACPII